MTVIYEKGTLIMGKSLEIVSSRFYIRWWIACLAAVLLTAVVLPVYGQSLPRAADRAESLTQPIRAGSDLSPLKPRRAGVSPTPVSISIPPPAVASRAAETAAVPPPGAPYKIGFGRDIPDLGSPADTAARLQWQVTPEGGRIAAISITSPQAMGIRLGILVRRLAADATLRFYAQGAEAAYEVSGREVGESIKRNLAAGEGGDDALTYWSPHIEGQEATLEIELPPGIGGETVEISIPRVSHFFRSPLAAGGDRIIRAIGDAASCEIDVSCSMPLWSAESNATARMVYVDGGSSFQCSGTLLNDMAASGTPYFLSANHCISKQTAASTLQTYWFYRSTACNSGTLNPGNRTLTGGATLLYASSVTDTSFMRLLSAPPAGAMYAAWDSSAPTLQTAVAGVHHPRGDLQKISSGRIQSFEDCTIPDPVSDTFTCNASTQASAEYLDVTFTSGITEAGSSGSGLFKTSGGSHYLIGQLYGGNASCSNPSGSNDYGRFDVAYNAALHQWLNAGSTYSLSVGKSGNGSGTVTSAPGGIDCGSSCIAPFAPGSGVTLTATPAAGSTFAGWSGACSGTGATCSLVMNADTSVTANFTIVTITLGMALNNTSLDWTTGGDAPFTAQTTTSHSGGSAVQTGRIGHNQSTYLATTVTGPGTLSFYWRVSSERGYDIFSVYLDGSLQFFWSGSTAWFNTQLSIPAGTHTVRWEYVKDVSISSGQDAGWVDDVVFTPSCTYTLPSTSVSYTTQETIGAVTINATSRCGWTASSNVPWITITSGGTGAGNGNVLFYVAANTGAQRIGTITIAGLTFTIIQAGISTYLDYVDAVQKIYIGYYRRPADPAGLIYWAERLRVGGGNLDAIIEAFANSAESLALHGTITVGNISTVINDTYLALFTRPADAGGIDYYVTGFTAGQFTAATIVLNILDGATGGNDLLTVNNKLAAANLFTRTIDPELDGTAFQATYAGDADAVSARQFLVPVTWSAQTIPTQSQTTAYIQANISNPGDILAPTGP